MTHRRLGAWLLALALAAGGCKGCARAATPGAITGGRAVAPVHAAAPDAGPPPPYQRLVSKFPPLPRQANLAQIFLGFDHGAAPWLPAKARKRTLADAKALAERLAEEARHGSDFDVLARKESEWPLADRNGAAFGIQTEGGPSMVTEFDATIFKLKVGEISEPLVSPLGYHVFKRLPAVHVAHILIGIHDGRAGPPARTKAEAQALADKIEQALKGGGDFGAEAFEQSDDLTSAGRAGDIGVLDPRTAKSNPIYAPAERLAVGAVSAPIETAAGFEILKRLE